MPPPMNNINTQDVLLMLLEEEEVAFTTVHFISGLHTVLCDKMLIS